MLISRADCQDGAPQTRKQTNCLVPVVFKNRFVMKFSLRYLFSTYWWYNVTSSLHGKYLPIFIFSSMNYCWVIPSDTFFFFHFSRNARTPLNWGSAIIKMAAKIRGVLIDLSGTIHIENTVIPGSIQALKRYFISKIYDGSFFVFKYVSLQIRIRISDNLLCARQSYAVCWDFSKT